MKRGKIICKELKAIRRHIADENGIDLQQPECTHTGDCSGTCPRCEAEVRFLEQVLSQRLKLGKVATVAGLTLSLSACGGTASPTLRSDTPPESNCLIDSALPTVSNCLIDSALDTLPPAIDADTLPDIVVGFSLLDTIPTDEIIETDNPDSSPTQSSALRRPDLASSDDVFEGEAEIFHFVQVEAEFPGGQQALVDYLQHHLHYPEDSSVVGTVVVSFVVEVDGSLSNFRLLRDIGGGCGQEALRVIKAMPKWIPGKNKGHAVRSWCSLPIVFEK